MSLFCLVLVIQLGIDIVKVLLYSSLVFLPTSFGLNFQQVIYEDPVTGADFDKQTLTTTTGKQLKYGSLIIATGCTASR